MEAETSPRGIRHLVGKLLQRQIRHRHAGQVMLSVAKEPAEDLLWDLACGGDSAGTGAAASEEEPEMDQQEEDWLRLERMETALWRDSLLQAYAEDSDDANPKEASHEWIVILAQLSHRSSESAFG